MNISYTFKNFEPSEHLKKYAARRFEKLGRYLPKKDNIDVAVNMTVDKFRHKIDVKFVSDSLNIAAMEESTDMYAGVDMVLDKLESQIKKHMEKAKERRRGAGAAKPVHMDVISYEPFQEKPNSAIEGVEYYEARPLFVDDALLQLGESADDLLVFFNAETGAINVLQKRKDGTFRLVVPGF